MGEVRAGLAPHARKTMISLVNSPPLLVAACLAILGCGRVGYDPLARDGGGRDASMASDANAAERDAGPLDAAALDAAALDAAAVDGSGADAGVRDLDAGFDAAGTDAGPAPPQPDLLFPWNGFTTGSALVSSARRPTLRWRAASGALSYDCEVDDDPAFASPEVRVNVPDGGAETQSHRIAIELPVSTTVPVGRRYYWRVRSRSGIGLAGFASAWSGTRYMDVGRQAQDLNGDGYADLIVGAPFQTLGGGREGAAFVYYGAAGGYPVTPSLRIPNPDAVLSGYFGFSITAAGDLNADGYADAIIGASFQGAVNSGLAFLFLGGSAGLSMTPTLRIVNPTAESSSFFGGALAGIGDVNADGFGDVIIGASSLDGDLEGQGAAFVFYGMASGISATPSLRIDSPEPFFGGGFGGTITGAGDLDGDGYPDAAIGASHQELAGRRGGAAFIFHGSSAGLSATPTLRIDNPDDQFDAAFGAGIGGLGDVDADGYADLLIGSPGQSAGASREGNVFFYRGSAAGLSPTTFTRFDNPGNQDSSYFGTSVARAGDVNGDGFQDALVGASAYTTTAPNTGCAFVLLGSAAGLGAIPAPTIPNPDMQNGAQFGSYATGGGGGDANADGFADIAVSSPSHANGATNEGNAFVYYGSAAGTALASVARLDNPDNDANGQFSTGISR